MVDTKTEFGDRLLVLMLRFVFCILTYKGYPDVLPQNPVEELTEEDALGEMELPPAIEQTERAPFDDEMTPDDEKYPDIEIETDPIGSNETGKKGENEPPEKLHGVKSAETDPKRDHEEEIEEDII